jgi:hypothetical protein
VLRVFAFLKLGFAGFALVVTQHSDHSIRGMKDSEPDSPMYSVDQKGSHAQG